ncbi:MAG TPA: SUMF1/EgtB/PvdO family nonheme iron enzyme [Capsulimonadaceae bacterium]|nr:SUMF1/EgtB/PvdO family nonheme iron enzyme [Capsulimonadaceae bacterium]
MRPNGARRSWIAVTAFLFTALIGFAPSPARPRATIPMYTLSLNDARIAGPAAPADFPAWIAAMRAWRAEKRSAIHDADSLDSEPALRWTRSAFMQSFLMVEDRYYYDPSTRTYTVGRYLADLKKRYGGVDSVIIWPTYPNIGIDERNTTDMLIDMPGGIAGLRRVVADFHAAGVRVFLPIHPWDNGTRDPGEPWSGALGKLAVEVDADGLFGDTMASVPKEYLDHARAKNHPLALQPESGAYPPDLDAIGWNTLSWGYRNPASVIPMVSQEKWLDPRHMMNICDRWATDKTTLLQYAFFNGVGIVTWENVWGIWVPLTDRDCEALKRVARIERAFPDLLTSAGWEPHTPTIHGDTVFASKWPNADGSETLWTLINHADSDLSGAQLEVSNRPAVRYFDLWQGVPIAPKTHGDRATLSFPMEAHGYGAVLAVEGDHKPTGLAALLAAMRRSAKRSLSSFSATSPVLPQRMTPIPRTAPAAEAPEGMVLIHAARFQFKVQGLEIEGGDRPGVDIQCPWETEPSRAHDHALAIAAFFIDKYPVTNAQFKRFLDATNYKPAASENFLKDWKKGAYPAGWADKPVTWVSLEDARAYASWAGKRLPHEWEWQYAAQGTDGRVYPWGNDWDVSKVAPADMGRSLTGPADVTASTGESPFGVRDLVGNVWQWTDEYADKHTRAAILRGGSYYKPQGSDWYFPQAYRLDQHGKYLLMAPARDRSGTIGFRCVKDAANGR